jgi:hypothetical protein
MLKHDPIVDPCPSIHRFIRRGHEALSDPDPRYRRRRVWRWLLPLLLLFAALQGLNVLLIQRGAAGASDLEYVSDRILLGYPLYAHGERPVAWIAVGGMPRGFVAIGGVSLGVIAIGGLAAGVVPLGGLALGLLALGGAAVGLLAAIGGLAIGHYSLGGLSIGGIAYAGQGVARGRTLAAGGQSERLLGRR